VIKFVISGTIQGEYEFPNDRFDTFCYEGWGNCWAMIGGVQAKYIPAAELIANPGRFEEIDILMAELGQIELLRLAKQNDVFIIATQSGPGFELDRENTIDRKLEFMSRLNACDVILSTTHAGKEYLSLFTDTPVLDLPLPMNVQKFKLRPVKKFEEFTICLGEIIESCYDDRPLQLEAASIAQSLGMRVVASIAPHSRNFGEKELKRLGLAIDLYPHQSLFEMSFSYLPRSHVSMMLGQRPTFGRFVYVSWAIGIPCIASRYHYQERICPELTVDYQEIDKIKSLLVRLRDDFEFYAMVCKKGREKIVSRMSMENVALRIVTEILPLYLR